MNEKAQNNVRQVATNVKVALTNALTFQKSLTDLVKGIRNSKNNEKVFISQCVQEIKEELKSDDIKTRAIAVQKLTYVSYSLYFF